MSYFLINREFLKLLLLDRDLRFLTALTLRVSKIVVIICDTETEC